jgi:rRNA-processing protein FCF1
LTGDYFSNLIAQYRNKGLLIDSNLLLLYFVGSYDPERIGTFKRTHSRGFTPDDFDLLLRLLTPFGAVVTTPNILTEVSNLSNQLRDDEKDTYYSVFADRAGLLTEQYTESKKICRLEHFRNFGLTDSGIISMAKGNYLVLTDDAPLVGYLQNVGIDVINFNHLRSLTWGN